jgi:hypothetical protein
MAGTPLAFVLFVTAHVRMDRLAKQILNLTGVKNLDLDQT